MNAPQKQVETAPPLLVEETVRYRLTLTSDSQQLECRAQIEIFSLPSPEISAEDPHQPANHSNGASAAQTVANTIPFKPLLSPPDLLWYLQQNGIVEAIDYSALYEFCAALELDQEPGPSIIARGKPPLKGQDGWFELLVKPFGSAVKLQEDESGRIDHKNLNTYTAIERGMKLGLVHSPQQGTPGLTFQGLPIPAEPGDPYQLTAGEGVILKYGDRVAFAEKSGQAVLNKTTLSVVDSLSIPGDIDLSIGDINFNGLVEIKGEIPDDFDVKAGAGLVVHGPVGACQIESGGNLELRSMAGKEVGTIICRGDLRAQVLNQVNVYCYGDVLVRNEIRNCRIRATGRIQVERGAIIGGSCVAYAGIDAQTLGTPLGQATTLTAGRYFPDADRFTYLQQRRIQIGQQLKSIHEAIAPLKRLIKKNPEIASTGKKRLAILEEQAAKLKDEQHRTRSEIQASTKQSPAGRNAKINAHKKIWEGVQICLGQTSETLRQDRRGPVTVCENRASGGLRFMPLSSLAVCATEQEESLDNPAVNTSSVVKT